MLVPHVDYSFFKELNTIAPLITSFIIAPHGMTDLIHAQENKVVDRLNVIYLLSIIGGVSSTLLNHRELLDIIFIVSSVIHFRNDFPFKNKYLQMISSSVFISQLGHINLTWFFAYMSFVHVPNHYMRFGDLIDKHRVKSFAYIFGLGLLVNSLFENNPDIIDNIYVNNISKSIIIAHIIYGELFTKEGFKNIRF